MKAIAALLLDAVLLTSVALAQQKEAVAALKSGKSRFERVENGNLRVVTLVPLVDKSCQMCHTKDKVGDPIGGLAYTVPLVNGK